MFRANNQNIAVSNPNTDVNDNDAYNLNENAKIRLGFISANNFHRQILLGFMNEKATANIDAGYDGKILDEQANDMFFKNQNVNLIIQGVGYFNENVKHPLTVKSSQLDFVEIVLDGVENFDSNRKIFIYDAQTNLYHNIKNQAIQN